MKLLQSTTAISAVSFLSYLNDSAGTVIGTYTADADRKVLVSILLVGTGDSAGSLISWSTWFSLTRSGFSESYVSAYNGNFGNNMTPGMIQVIGGSPFNGNISVNGYPQWTTNAFELPLKAGDVLKVYTMPDADCEGSGFVDFFGTETLAEIAAEISTLLNTAIPGSPTADSVYQRIAAIDDLTQASGGGDLAAILTDTGTTLDTLIKDVPTVAEFEARTLVAADYTVVSDLGTVQTGDAYARLGAPAGASVSADVAAVKAQTAAIEADTQDLQTQIGTDGDGLTALPWNAAWDAEVQSEAADALTAYDPPTKAELDSAVSPLATAAALADVPTVAEFEARTLAAADYTVVSDLIAASAIADAVWDEAIADHDGVGSTGAALAAAGGSGDPWATALPGAYGSGTAGKIIGDYLNAPVDTVDTVVDGIAATLGVAGAGLTALPWNAAWDAEVQSEAADALTAYDPPTKAELDSAVSPLATAAAVADVPTVAEFEARTLAAADYTVVSDLGTVQTGDAYARLGAPAGASVSADIAAVKAQTAAIEADTQDLQTQIGTDGNGLTAIPWNAAWDAEVQSEAADALTAYDPPTKAELDSAVSPLATAADLADVPTVAEFEARTLAAADYTVVSDLGTVQTGDAYARLGAPAGASVSADIAAVKAQTAAIEADTQDLQTQIGTDGNGLTALPWNAAWDAEVQSEAADALTAYDPPTKAELDSAVSPLATQTSVDDLPTNSELATALAGADDATLAAIGALHDLDSTAVQSAAAAALTAYDPPTKAELDSAVSPLATATALETVDGIVDDILEDTSTTIPDAIAAIEGVGGSGTGTYTDTITDGVDPLDGVRVQLSTDSAGRNRVYETFTNATGSFTLYPDPGTYYRWLDLAGYSFTQGVEIEVVAP